jgi:hypothetical protein
MEVGNGRFLRLAASGRLLLRGGGLSWDDSVVSSISPDAGAAGAAEPAAAEPLAAAPFAADGGSVGVLVLHGFTGSPQTIRDWASYLAAAGLSVRAPLLAGHGGTWQDLAKTGWTDWYADAERAFSELSSRCSQVFVAASRWAAAWRCGWRRRSGNWSAVSSW